MIRNRLPSVFVLAAVVCTAAPAWAATWEYVGTSGFTTTPSLMQDRDSIRYNSIAVDNQNYIYATAVNDNNSGTSGGLTIYGAGGSKLDVDLNALGLTGGITKLVKGGDSKIYGVQNWMKTTNSTTQYNVNRIIRIDPSATPPASEIWNAGALATANRIGGLTVGGDGNVYWTMNAEDGGWKYRFFFRYNVSTQTVEESPMNPNILPDPPASTNNGWGQRHRMFDLEYTGTYAGPNLYGSLFCVVGFSTAGSDSTWVATPMAWDMPRQQSDALFCPQDYDATMTGYRGITATAYDPVRRKLWVGSRGINGDKSWDYGGLVTANVIDVGDGNGNKGLQVYKRSGKGESFYAKREINPTSVDPHVSMVSLAARFRVESITSAPGIAFGANILKASTDTNQQPETKPEVALRIVETGIGTGVYRYKLWDTVATGGGVEIADIAPVVLSPQPGSSTWEECYIFINGTGHDGDDTDLHTVQCWWNGTKVYDQEYTLNGSDDAGNAKFGAICDSSTDASIDYVTFDWVGVAPWKVVPGEGTWPVGVTPPDRPLDDPPFFSKDQGFWHLACDFYPDLLNYTNWMTRFNGAADSPGLFDTSYDGLGQSGASDGCAGPGTIHFNPNGHCARLDDVGEHGYYWVSTMAVNPADGSAWMSWGAQAAYDYPGTYGTPGGVYCVGPDDAGPGWSEGMPQTAHPDLAKAGHASQVVAVAFFVKHAYALTLDMATGEYNLFRALLPGVCNNPPQDVDGDTDVDLGDFGAFQACFNGPNRSWVGAIPAQVCACLDTDTTSGIANNGDGDLDLTDFGAFQGCFNGPNRPPACQ